MNTVINNLNEHLFQKLDDEMAANLSGGVSIIFDNLVCKEIQDGVGDDELYLKVGGKTIWERSDVSKNDSFNLRASGSQPITNDTIVELWEADPVGDDLIGSFKPSQYSGKNPVELNRGGRYTLTFTKSR